MKRTRISKGTILVMIALLGVATACGSSKKSNPPASSPPVTTSASSPSASPSASATAPAQTETITPNKGLVDKQVVTVVGKGFTAGKQYGITECADKGAATGANDCNLRGIKVGVADATGTVTVKFPVAKGPFGGNNIVCTKAPGCIVSVANAGSAAPTEVAAASITFAA